MTRCGAGCCCASTAWANAGLKRFAGGRSGYSYKELLHTHRRYIDAEAVRDPRIWG